MNNLFDSKSALAASTAPDFSRPIRSKPLPQEAIEQIRREAVREGATYVRGSNGVTVLRLAGPDYRYWDGTSK
jgi:hypothetical protein